MSWGALVNHVVDVAPLGAPYIGGGAWAASSAPSRTSPRWRASLSNSAESGATAGTAERRQAPSEVLAGHGRPNRKRRQYLNRARAAAARRRRDRRYLGQGGQGGPGVDQAGPQG